MDIVFLEGFHAETIVGINHDEQHRLQPIELHLALGRTHNPACQSDCIHDAVDYAAVRQAVLALLLDHQYKLLEALAEAIAGLLLKRFELQWVRVSVAKVDKFPDVARVGVRIERTRGV